MTSREPRSLKDSLSGRVAEEIRVLMLRKNKTQRQLAAELGMSVAALSYRLTGTQELGLNEVERIARLLDVEVSDLMPSPAVASAA